MARYSLILKDATYITLAQDALKRGKTLGRFLNDLLNQEAERIQKGEAGGLPMQSICVVCGGRAVFETHGFGQQKLYVCTAHLEDVKRVTQGYKPL